MQVRALSGKKPGAAGLLDLYADILATPAIITLFGYVLPAIDLAYLFGLCQADFRLAQHPSDLILGIAFAAHSFLPLKIKVRKC